MFTIVVDFAGVGEEVPTTGFRGKIARGRLLEGTGARLRKRLDGLDDEDREKYLAACPVLWTPEHASNDTNDTLAYIGRFSELQINEHEVSYTFKPYEGLAAISGLRLREMEDVFQFGRWGWSRTRMVAFEGDVLDLLGADVIPTQAVRAPSSKVPGVFTIEPKSHDKLVSVMMPFTLDRLNPVFSKIDMELADRGIHCERADTDLSARRIIDKVATLIYNADVVICDFTSTNPNVFYEAGLAHAWSKSTVFIAEKGTPLPFDTRDEQTIFYDNTDLGIKRLWYKIWLRLERTNLVLSA